MTLRTIALHSVYNEIGSEIGVLYKNINDECSLEFLFDLRLIIVSFTELLKTMAQSKVSLTGGLPPFMDAETARRLFFQGGNFIFLDFPPGSEFGIDYNSWTTGEKFKGVKMIPPGVHFIYFRYARRFTLFNSLSVVECSRKIFFLEFLFV